MGRLFAGTKWDRPPVCERCGLLESECSCPPPEAPPAEPLDPKTQTAHLRIEKRAKGKRVTTVRNLSPTGNDLAGLSAKLKTACGGGGTVQDDGTIEIQGEHIDRVAKLLSEIGYRVKHV